MGIGTSHGAFYEDQFHQAVAEWDPDKYDGDNAMVLTPNNMDALQKRKKELDAVEMQELGGIEVNNKMPFPDNRNPDMDFNNRFPNLPPSGVLNDIKPRDPVPQLQRRLDRRVEGELPIVKVSDRAPLGVMGAAEIPEGTAQGQGIKEYLDGVADIIKIPGKVQSGEIPMFYTDENGEQKLHPEGIKAALEMALISLNPAKFPAAKAAVDAPAAETVDSIMETLRRRSRNMERDIPPSHDSRLAEGIAAEARHLRETLNDPSIGARTSLPRQPHEDPTDYALRLIGEALDHPSSTYTSAPVMTPEIMRSMADRLDLRQIARSNLAEKTKALGNDKFSEGPMYFNKIANEYSGSPSSYHKFRFFNEQTGSMGDLKISERNGGKQLYVEGIGLGGSINPNEMGRAATNDMLKALAKEFPEAETIAGFRVSGARGKSGKTGHAEMSLARFRGKNKIEGIGHNGGPAIDD